MSLYDTDLHCHRSYFITEKGDGREKEKKSEKNE